MFVPYRGSGICSRAYSAIAVLSFFPLLPVAYGVWCGIAGAIAFILMEFSVFPIIAIAMGACVAALVHGIYTVTAHMGRIVGQSQFEQPLFMDVLTQSLGPIVGHGFITTFCLVGVSYLMIIPINGTALHVFPLPLLAMLWGIALGAIGSSTGDVHYGAESEYQKFDFGGGTPSQLEEKDFIQLFETIYKIYTVNPEAEITIEANPDDLTSEYIAMLRTLPFNRLSMGIQTFKEDTLRLLHRRHTAAQAQQAYQHCREAGFQNISIDLMYAITKN